MNRMPRPLRLGARTESDRSVPMSRPSTPAPNVPLPSPPAVDDTLQVPIARLAYTMDTMLAPDRPPPSPPFRLLPPSTQGSVVDGHERTQAWATASQQRRSPSLQMPEPDDLDIRSQHGIETTRALKDELRSRPMTDSHYGKQIIGLLQMQWVEAPSGLIATVFGADIDMYHVKHMADIINALVCGTEALAHEGAGILALYSVQQLNRLLSRSGISPIVAQPAASTWGPLAARKPPEFLLEGYRLRGKHPDVQP